MNSLLKQLSIHTGKILCFAVLFFRLHAEVHANTFDSKSRDSFNLSTAQQAFAYLRKMPLPGSSLHWPNIRPAELMENLRLFIENPFHAIDNKNTNFCGYTAVTYAAIRYDPLGFVKFLEQLYNNGQAKLGSVDFKPGKKIRLAAGKLKYKGMLDINPATQMWILSLGDHFKGYLNFFNRRYDEGDENTLWASTNFAKFNRMLRRLFGWKIKARGADLVRPRISDLYGYLQERMGKGTVFLYLNNRLLYKKNNVVVRVGLPTHYVLLTEISEKNGMIDITYLDGNRKTLQQVSPDFLQQIVYGITFRQTE